MLSMRGVIQRDVPWSMTTMVCASQNIYFTPMLMLTLLMLFEVCMYPWVWADLTVISMCSGNSTDRDKLSGASTVFVGFQGDHACIFAMLTSRRPLPKISRWARMTWSAWSMPWTPTEMATWLWKSSPRSSTWTIMSPCTSPFSTVVEAPSTFCRWDLLLNVFRFCDFAVFYCANPDKKKIYFLFAF